MPYVWLRWLLRSLLGASLCVYSLWSLAQDDPNCKKDSEGTLWCAPVDGGIGQRPNGEVFCGVGQCMNMTNGAVVCAAKEGGRTSLNYIGQAVCAGNCVPGKQALCVKAK